MKRAANRHCLGRYTLQALADSGLEVCPTPVPWRSFERCGVGLGHLGGWVGCGEI